MRILVTVPWGRRLGGAEEMLQAALEGASVAGHEVDLVFLQAGPWAQELERAGFHVEVLAAGRLRHAHRAVAGVVRLARILRRRDPDLIVSWMPKTHLYGAPAALLAGMTDRLVWWQHGIARGEWIDRVVTLLPTRAVGCSSLAAARAQERMWPSRPTFVVNPGTRVPTARANGSPLALPPGVPTVGLVGRMQPLKGQDRLLRAQALLRQRGHTIHTVLVGGEAHGLSEEYASSLTPLVERLGLRDDVTMTGQVPDAGPYIDQMDILVNASDPPESFGIVLLEAMARGVPVVAVDSGSPGELIEDGRTGVLARSADPSALADALQPILESSELRHAIGEAGRARFTEDFTDVAMRGRFWGQLERLARPQRGASDAS
ncbi:MAG TPA: glycosyltransferase [Solirubrobacteraceae bacterium]|nr:glycosyltransferase [Solirubrobacteraceae bacterium]